MTLDIDLEQGSPEWHQARAGKVTASRINAVMSNGRGGDTSETRHSYMLELVGERLSGEVEDGPKSKDMRHGTDTEAQARAAYIMETGNLVKEVGFIQHPTIPWAGASPDGIIGEKGGLEAKCPKKKTHIAFLLTEEIPLTYMQQMQWGMACTGRRWWDFISYHPKMPHHLRLKIVRVFRDDDMIRHLEAGVITFIVDMRAMLSDIDASYGGGDDD